MNNLDISGWLKKLNLNKINYLNLAKYIPLALLFIYLYIYKLSSIVNGISIQEKTLNYPKQGIGQIFNDPSFLGLKLVRYIFGIFSNTLSVFEIRLASVFFGLLSIFFIYRIIASWLGRRAALLGTVLFSFSAWTLHISRLGINSIAYTFCVITLIYSIVVLKKYFLNSKYFLIITALVWPALLFTPGMILFVIFAILRCKKELSAGFKNLKNPYYYYIPSALITLGLLIKYFMGSMTNIFTFFGLSSILTNWENLPLNIVKTLYHLFLFGPNQPEIWLNKAPVLDFLILFSSIFGIYFYSRNLKKSPAVTLFTCFGIGLFITALNNNNDLSLLTPLMYIFSATGIALFIQRWLKVFPKNPIARAIGLSLVYSLVVLSCILNYRAYFIAWPHNKDVKSYFISIN